jgi:glyoxylate reductase
MDSPNREDFLKNLQEGGKYEGTVAIYREGLSSVPRVGIFDRELIGAFPRGVRWIAHNGAGYDQIDVNACKEKGTFKAVLSLQCSETTYALPGLRYPLT